ncbi:N-acetylmuramoyl-L-alanine amidase [Streptomyces sp. NPDC048172]|uniref:N-acetylmuramoyl-L-alanine amidase n=1 Tax=Streptomyces sp. NPDC048172 TaxID=3365505 RepID=UPI003724741C
MFNGSRLGGTLIVVLAALVPACFAGWLVWQSLDGSGEPDEKTATAPAHTGEGKGESEGDGEKRDGKHGEKPDGKSGGNGRHKEPAKPLTGMTVVLDPGHNPGNREHPDKISRRVDIGTAKKECDTTGTATNSGYPEAKFTLDLARRTRTALEARGARVRLTHEGDVPYGPCVDERARKGNEAKADAVVSLHADGAPSGSRGFHVILPGSVRKGDADTRHIAKPSRRLGGDLRDAFREATGERPANYLGDGEGLDTREDLGGLNLSKVPKVFLECGNMRDARDASRLTSTKWRTKAADGITRGIESFLTGNR